MKVFNRLIVSLVENSISAWNINILYSSQNAGFYSDIMCWNSIWILIYYFKLCYWILKSASPLKSAGCLIFCRSCVSEDSHCSNTFLSGRNKPVIKSENKKLSSHCFLLNHLTRICLLLLPCQLFSRWELSIPGSCCVKFVRIQVACG